MDTKDLISYYPGYENYEERKSKVPFEDYRVLEDKIEIYDKVVEEIKDTIEDDTTGPLEKLSVIKTLLVECLEELEKC